MYETTEMSRDAELLADLTAEAPLVTDRVTGHLVPLSRKVLGYWTGRAAQTLSDYALGKRTIPVEFWRRLLEHHLEPRVVALLIPDSVTYELFPLEVRRSSAGLDFFRQALELEKAHHEKMLHVLEIIADGHVDELDASSIAAYSEGHHAHRLRDGQLYHAIIDTFNQAATRRATR